MEKNEKPDLELMQISMENFSESCRNLARILDEIDWQSFVISAGIPGRPWLQTVGKSGRKWHGLMWQVDKKSLTTRNKNVRERNRDPT